MSFQSSRFLPAARLSFITLATVAAASASAQVKTDGEWRGTGGLALSATSGNSSSTALALNADMARATVQDKISLGASSNYARSKNQTSGVTSTTANKWAGFGQYDYNLSSALFVFGKLGAEGDALTELTLRTTLAGGLGLKVINTKENSFNVFGGAAYTSDRYDTAQVIAGRTSKTFNRSSLFLGEESSHQLAANTSFKQRLELYPGLSGDKAFLAKFSAGLAVAVSSNLNATVGLTDSYNSKPPAGAKKNDLGLFMGVSVKFGAP
jgi:putative salt-induced outer membrane protein